MSRKKNQCSVSVLVPVGGFSHDHFKEAVQSLIGQTFTDFEVIFLVTESCYDAFKAELESFDFGSIHVSAYSIKLKGLSFALNIGIEKAEGEYLARMDIDDVSSIRRFEEQVAVLKNNPEIGVVGCRVKIISEESLPLPFDFKFYQHDLEIRRALRYRNSLCHPALMFRKSTLLDVGGYKFGGYSEDHELFLRIARFTTYKFYNLPDILFYYRRHAAQATNSRNAWRAFRDVSGFLYTEFLYSLHPLCLLGMAAIFPPLRRLRNLFR